jgi:hypothetical protein
MNIQHLINTPEQAMINGLCLETFNLTRPVSIFTNLRVHQSGNATADRLYLETNLPISTMDMILLRQADASG